MTGQWTLGSHICDMWITSDVFCCTASILNIVVIAVDRYWLITRNVRYTHSTVLPRRSVCAILTTVAWILSALIASSPLLGWRTGNERDDPTSCVISQDYGYTIFSTFGAFWFPLSIILVVYARIFWFARSRVMRLQQAAGKVRTAGGAFDDARSCAIGTTYTGEPTTVMAAAISCQRKSRTIRSVDSNSPSESTAAAAAVSDQVSTQNQMYSTSPPLPFTLASDPVGTVRPPLVVESSNAAARMRKTRLRRMRRSARTLGLIIGGFVICWLPFFVVATVAPFCSWCTVPPSVNSVVLWLGYSNSLFNPAIYAIWDQSFRRSFKRILMCQLR